MIDNLLAGRRIIKDYYDVVAFKGIKVATDIKRMQEFLEDIGFNNANDFFVQNIKMNLLEIDRCFRFRLKEDLSAPALCDSCAGRVSIPCYSSEILCGQSGVDYTDIFITHTPDSQFLKEQHDAATAKNITPAFFPSPITHLILSAVGYTLPDCVGVSHQIVQPRFDVLWQMEGYAKLGIKLLNRAMEAKIS